jgi:hypothetical protein
MIEMWLYNQRQWKAKWKDLKTFNVEMQTLVDAGGLELKEGIGLKWSCRFRLDGLDV